MKTRAVIIVVSGLSAIVLLLIVNALIIKFNGSAVPTPSIPRGPETTGSGPRLKFIVMGDSTTIGQGTTYNQSYTAQAVQYLARHYTVTFANVGVSGARAGDVAAGQLRTAKLFKPDIVLLAVGANDATHLTNSGSFKASTQKTVDGLKAANPNVKIIVTGSPEMGSVPLFPWPARQLAGLRTRQINTVYATLITQNKLIFAPIAKETGPAFAADPTLFAKDKFHPNERGYALWTAVITRALDKALAK